MARSNRASPPRLAPDEGRHGSRAFARQHRHQDGSRDLDPRGDRVDVAGSGIDRGGDGFGHAGDHGRGADELQRGVVPAHHGLFDGIGQPGRVAVDAGLGPMNIRQG